MFYNDRKIPGCPDCDSEPMVYETDGDMFFMACSSKSCDNITHDYDFLNDAVEAWESDDFKNKEKN